KPVTALVAGIAVAILIGLLRLSGLLDLWELKTRDYRTQGTLGPERKVRPDLLLINLTDESLKLMDESIKGGMKWPWDREIQAHIVNACTRGKASSLLYDFLINEA